MYIFQKKVQLFFFFFYWSDCPFNFLASLQILLRYHSFYILSSERYSEYLLPSNCDLATKYMLFATHPWKIVWDYEDTRSHWCNAKILSLCFLWSTLLYFLVVILLLLLQLLFVFIWKKTYFLSSCYCPCVVWIYPWRRYTWKISMYCNGEKEVWQGRMLEILVHLVLIQDCNLTQVT